MRWFVVGVWMTGCAATPVRPAPARDCTIGLLSQGSDPGRPYRVVGKVSAEDEAVSDRQRSLVHQACAMGAQAVVGVYETIVPNGNNFGTAEGPHVWASQNEGRPATAGLAVVFTDGRRAPQPTRPTPTYVFPAN